MVFFLLDSIKHYIEMNNMNNIEIVIDKYIFCFLTLLKNTLKKKNNYFLFYY